MDTTSAAPIPGLTRFPQVPVPIRPNSPPTVLESILMGSVPANPVYEDSACAAITDANPVAPFHVIIFPKDKTRMSCLGDINETEGLIIGHMIHVAKVIAETFGYKEGYRIVINDGVTAGQTIPHIVIHLLAGRPFSWPPG